MLICSDAYGQQCRHSIGVISRLTFEGQQALMNGLTDVAPLQTLPHVKAHRRCVQTLLPHLSAPGCIMDQAFVASHLQICD